MDEPGLNRLLVEVVSNDPDRIERTLASPIPAMSCLPLSRLRSGVLRENWNDGERTHLTSCTHCRKSEQLARSQLWHPSLVHLFWHARGLFDNNDADVAYHLQHDSCRRCLRLSVLLGADRILARLAGQIRAGVGNAANRLGKTLASGIVANFIPNTANVRFAFEDGQHALVASADPARLRLEVAAVEAPRLLRVLVSHSRGMTEHLVVPRSGPQPAVHLAELLLSPSSSDPACLTVYKVEAGLLTRDDVAPLRAAFLTSSKLDPPAVAAWQAWAAQTLQRPELDAMLRPVLETLARPDAPKQCL